MAVTNFRACSSTVEPGTLNPCVRVQVPPRALFFTMFYDQKVNMNKAMNKETVQLECIDIGANLTSKKFRNDLDTVLDDSKAAGVSTIILTGSSEKNSEESSILCENRPGFLYSTAGIHPHDASEFDPQRTTATLESLYQLDHVVAVGECGLDFNRDFSPRDKQRVCFAAHLELAAKNA